MNRGVLARGVGVSLDGTQVLDGIDLAVGPGCWQAIVGPNGAGKTTLLRALAGLASYRGEVLIDGEDGARLSPRQRARRVAYVPQQPTMPPSMTVAAYVLLGRTPHRGYLSAEGRADRVATHTAMSRLDLLGFAHRRLATLSGGERQRVVLARALAQQAHILLLDEPTSALDLGHQAQVMELVDELRRDDGMSVVTTVHDLNVAAAYASQLLLLVAGRVVVAGSPERVLTEDNIARYYGASVRVTLDEQGTPVVTARRAPRRPEEGSA